MRSIVLIFLLFSGCSPYIRTEGGAGTPFFISEYYNEGTSPGAVDWDVANFSVQYGGTLVECGEWKGLGSIGPTVVQPLDGNGSTGSGLGALIWMQAPQWSDFFGPYIVAGPGVVYFSERLEDQGTHYGFLLQAGIGNRFRVDDTTSITIDYRFFHESNGSAIFGTPGPNPGYNSDMVFIGLEWKIGG